MRTGRTLKIRDLAQMMIKIFDVDSLDDICRLKTIFGFVPSIEIEGLFETDV
jgi:hypothetical protein